MIYTLDRRVISPIVAFEGGYKEEFYKPSTRSGWTIGAGVDYGHYDKHLLVKFLKEVSLDFYYKTRHLIGLSGEEADDARIPTLLPGQYRRVIEGLSDKILTHSYVLLEEEYNESLGAGKVFLEHCPLGAKIALLSIKHQYGRPPHRTPKFWGKAVEQDWAACVTELKNFGDRYPTRRNKEAEFLQRCIKT